MTPDMNDSPAPAPWAVEIFNLLSCEGFSGISQIKSKVERKRVARLIQLIIEKNRTKIIGPQAAKRGPKPRGSLNQTDEDIATLWSCIRMILELPSRTVTPLIFEKTVTVLRLAKTYLKKHLLLTAAEANLLRVHLMSWSMASRSHADPDEQWQSLEHLKEVNFRMRLQRWASAESSSDDSKSDPSTHPAEPTNDRPKADNAAALEEDSSTHSALSADDAPKADDTDALEGDSHAHPALPTDAPAKADDTGSLEGDSSTHPTRSDRLDADFLELVCLMELHKAALLKTDRVRSFQDPNNEELHHLEFPKLESVRGLRLHKKQILWNVIGRLTHLQTLFHETTVEWKIDDAEYIMMEIESGIAPLTRDRSAPEFKTISTLAGAVRRIILSASIRQGVGPFSQTLPELDRAFPSPIAPGQIFTGLGDSLVPGEGRSSSKNPIDRKKKRQKPCNK